MRQQKKTQPIYQRGGNVAKSKFDLSLLKPVDEQNASFESQLKPIDENEEDEGAYLDNLPEPEGFFHKLPKNILIGLTHAGRNLHNFPHDLSKLAEWPAEKIAGPLKHPLSSYLPYDEEDYSDVFGGDKTKDTMIDKLIKGGVEHAPELIGGVGLLRSGIRRLKGTHHLDMVQRAIRERGLNNFNYNPSTIEEARNYLPRSHATNEMIAASERGQYPSSFAIQTQIGKHQRDLVRSPLVSERLLAPRAGELKQNMLGELGNILRSEGMHEEADLLTRGINNYRQYMRVKNAVMPALKKFGIPTSILAAVGFGYKKAKKVLSD